MRTAADAVSNWTQRAAAASSFYGARIQASSWKQYASSDTAQNNWTAGVQAAITKKSYQTQISKVSDETWKTDTVNLGVPRYQQGVQAAGPKMAAVMDKLLPAIGNIRNSLPPRGIAGSQVNINRATTFMTQLHAQRGNFKAVGVAKATA